MTHSPRSDASPALERPAFEFLGDWSSRLVATSVHAGNDLRDTLVPLMVPKPADRFREEDPFTDEIARELPALAVAHRSRFEVDLNRPRDKAVYRVPADCWDLDVWSGGQLADDLVEESLEEYDAFYAELARRLDPLAERGPSCSTTCTATTIVATVPRPIRSRNARTPTSTWAPVRSTARALAAS